MLAEDGAPAVHVDVVVLDLLDAVDAVFHGASLVPGIEVVLVDLGQDGGRNDAARHVECFGGWFRGLGWLFGGVQHFLIPSVLEMMSRVETYLVWRCCWASQYKGLVSLKCRTYFGGLFHGDLDCQTNLSEQMDCSLPRGLNFVCCAKVRTTRNLSCPAVKINRLWG